MKRHAKIGMLGTQVRENKKAKYRKNISRQKK